MSRVGAVPDGTQVLIRFVCPALTSVVRTRPLRLRSGQALRDLIIFAIFPALKRWAKLGRPPGLILGHSFPRYAADSIRSDAVHVVARKIKVKGSGEECPLYTNRMGVRIRPLETVEGAGCAAFWVRRMLHPSDGRATNQSLSHRMAPFRMTEMWIGGTGRRDPSTPALTRLKPAPMKKLSAI